MWDPAENKDIKPSIRYSSDASRDKAYALLKRTRDGIGSSASRMMLRTVAAPTAPLAAAGPALVCGSSTATSIAAPACCSIRPTLSVRSARSGRTSACVTSATSFYGRGASVEVFPRKRDAEEILNHEGPTRAISDYIGANHDAFFFLKATTSRPSTSTAPC
jgi:hypothetical protein